MRLDGVNDIFLLVAIAWAILGVLTVAWVVVWLWRRKGRFAALATEPILYREVGASGCSHRNLLTRLGGARRVLEVIVTDRTLVVRLAGPFSILATTGWLDIEQVIPRGDIISVVPHGDKAVVVTFKKPGGETGRYELVLKDRDGFLERVRRGWHGNP
jgi:hypothetical protein